MFTKSCSFQLKGKKKKEAAVCRQRFIHSMRAAAPVLFMSGAQQTWPECNSQGSLAGITLQPHDVTSESS